MSDCDPKEWSTPESFVLHCLPVFAQIQVLWVSDANHLIIWCSFFCLLASVLQTSGSFPMNQHFASDDQNIWTSTSASVLPMIIQGWFPLLLTGLISSQSKELSKIFSNTTVQKHLFFDSKSSLWSNFHIHPRVFLWLRW